MFSLDKFIFEDIKWRTRNNIIKTINNTKKINQFNPEPRYLDRFVNFEKTLRN